MLLKMNNYQCLIIATVIYIMSFQISAVNSIKCYVCNSEIDGDCETISAEHHLKDCSEEKRGPEYKACRKIENWVDFEVLSQKSTRRIIRQCAVTNNKEKGCIYRAGFGGRANVCDCDNDGCNSATQPISSVIAMTITLGSVILLKIIV